MKSFSAEKNYIKYPMCVNATMCMLPSSHIDFPFVGDMVPPTDQGEGGQTICHILYRGWGILTQSVVAEGGSLAHTLDTI